jgi:hypothetical protein
MKRSWLLLGSLLTLLSACSSAYDEWEDEEDAAWEGECGDVPQLEDYYNDSVWEDPEAQDAWVEMWRTVYVVHQYEPQDDYTHQEPDADNTYPDVFDIDDDGEDDQFDRAWLDNLLSTVDRCAATHGMPLAVDEYGVNRRVPGAAQSIPLRASASLR